MAGVDPKTTDIFTLLRNNDAGQLEKVAFFYDSNNVVIEEFRTFPRARVNDVALGRSFNYDSNNNLEGTTAFVTQWTSVYEALATSPITNIILDNNQILPSQPAGTLIGSFTAVGGVGPFTFSLISNPGDLFEIVTINEIVTTSSLGVGNYPISVLVEDSVGQFDTQNFNIEVSNFQNNFSLLFNGTDEHVNFGTTADVQFDFNDPFTLSSWIFKVNTSGVQILMGNNGSGTNLNNLGIVWHFDTNANNRMLLHINNSGANQIRVRAELGAATLGRWIYVAATYDGSGLAAGVNLYLDGVNQTLTVLEDGLGGNTTVSTDPWTLAAKDNGAQAMLALIDEPSMWNTALNLTQIQEIYNSEEPTDLSIHSTAANLIHWWRNGDGDTPSSLTIADQVGTLTGTLINMEESNYVMETP